MGSSKSYKNENDTEIKKKVSIVNWYIPGLAFGVLSVFRQYFRAILFQLFKLQKRSIE